MDISLNIQIAADRNATLIALANAGISVWVSESGDLGDKKYWVNFTTNDERDDYHKAIKVRGE